LRIDMMSRGESLWEAVKRLAMAAHLKVEIDGPRALMLRPLADFEAWYRGRQQPAGAGAVGACPQCQYQRRSDWRFCPNCGNRFDAIAPPRAGS
jgi:hypothetical protein